MSLYWVKKPASIRADYVFSEKMKRKKHKNNPYMPYSDQLKTAEWRKKRDSILARDKYKCQGKHCDPTLDGENPPLDVHHKYYHKNFRAWEYPDHSLISLCPECHSVETELFEEAELRLKQALSKAGYMCDEIISLCEALENGGL